MTPNWPDVENKYHECETQYCLGYDDGQKAMRSACIRAWEESTQHGEYCSSAAPLTDKPCYICGAVKESRSLRELDKYEMMSFLHTVFAIGNLYKNFDNGTKMCIAEEICKEFGVPEVTEQTKQLIEDYIKDVESGIKYLESSKRDYGYGKDRLREKSQSLLSLMRRKG